MNFFKNRTVVGVICIVLSLLICFAVTPLFNAGISQKTSIVRVAKDIKAGNQITKDMVQSVEVGGYNLPENVLKSKDSVVGKYAAADLSVGDYLLPSKLSDTPAAENAYLYSLTGEKQAISVSVKTFADGLSGKLMAGDIVSVIAPDYKKQGTTVIPPELQYVEVIAVTASTGYDTDTESSNEKSSGQSSDEEKSLPSTVTLLATSEQSKILAMLEADGTMHLSLVYRGDKENADEFLKAQDDALGQAVPGRINRRKKGKRGFFGYRLFHCGTGGRLNAEFHQNRHFQPPD